MSCSTLIFGVGWSADILYAVLSSIVMSGCLLGNHIGCFMEGQNATIGTVTPGIYSVQNV